MAETLAEIEALLYRPRDKPWVNNAPFTAKGTFIGYIGDVYCMIAGADHDARAHEKFVAHIQVALLGPLDNKLGSILHVNAGPWWTGMTLSEKTATMKHFAAVLDSGEKNLRATMMGSANVLTSAVARAAARTVNTFVRPVNPLTVVDNAFDGFRFIAKRLPSLTENFDFWFRAYRRAVELHAPDLLPSVQKKG